MRTFIKHSTSMKPIKVHLNIIYPISNSLHNKNVFDYIFVVYVSASASSLKDCGVNLFLRSCDIRENWECTQSSFIGLSRTLSMSEEGLYQFQYRYISDQFRQHLQTKFFGVANIAWRERGQLEGSLDLAMFGWPAKNFIKVIITVLRRLWHENITQLKSARG